MKIKYTVMVNHSEYAVGIYDTKEDAEQRLIKLVKADCPDDDFDSYDDAQEFSDGYYRIREISIADEMDEKVDCNHPNLEVSKYIDHASCRDCGFYTSGWYCETSPTLECEYYCSETGYYDEDCCIHCGKPEERK